MRGNYWIGNVDLTRTRLLTDLTDLKDKPVHGMWDFLDPLFDPNAKIKGIRVMNLEFEVEGSVDIGIQCQRCTCTTPSGGWKWWEMKPTTINLSLDGLRVVLPIRVTPGPAGLKYAKTIYNLLLLASKAEKINWDKAFELTKYLKSDYLPPILKGMAILNDAALKKFCEKHWGKTNETPGFQ